MGLLPSVVTCTAVACCGIGRSWPGICDMRPWILLLARETNFSRRLCSPKGTKWFYFRNHPMNTIGRLLVCLYYLGKMKYNGHKSINVIFPRLARSGNDGNVYVLVYVRSTQNITVQYGDPYRSNIFNLGVIFLKLFS